MLLVIDTNILVNAIKSSDPNSKAAMLMRDVFNGVHKMCVSPDILDEYEDVLYRTELNLDRALVSYVLSWIKINAFLIDPKPTTQHEVQMVDEDDRIFFDVARCLNVRLVTRNYRDYPIDELITLIDEMYP